MVNMAYGFVAFEYHIISTKTHNNFVTGTCIQEFPDPTPCRVPSVQLHVHVCMSMLTLSVPLPSHSSMRSLATNPTSRRSQPRPRSSWPVTILPVMSSSSRTQSFSRSGGKLNCWPPGGLRSSVKPLSPRRLAVLSTPPPPLQGLSMCTCIVRRVWKVAYSRAVRISLCSSKLLRRHGST